MSNHLEQQNTFNRLANIPQKAGALLAIAGVSLAMGCGNPENKSIDSPPQPGSNIVEPNNTVPPDSFNESHLDDAVRVGPPPLIK